MLAVLYPRIGFAVRCVPSRLQTGAGHGAPVPPSVPRVKSSMSFVWPKRPLALARRADCLLALLSIGMLLYGPVGCGSTTPITPQPVLELSSITIPAPATGAYLVERGTHLTVAAVARNKSGIVVTVPFVWRSSNEKIVTVDMNGRLAALDTGTVTVFASALQVNSNPATVRVVWLGAAKIDTFHFTPPGAVSPGATPDSVRAIVTDRNGAPVANARVAFAVTGGGGTISPAIATTDSKGVASAEWKLGPAAGANTATATVLGEDDKVNAFVSPSSVSYTLKTFNAISTVDGDAQSGLILSALPVNPSVKVVDSTGKPRLGVPVTFTATGGGRVASTIVATGANGIASPGVWTLGDIAGDQTLIAKVEFATQTLHATATGTAVHYMPASVTAGAFATCALSLEGIISCWGEEPKVGDSSIVNKPAPTLTLSQLRFMSIAASPTSPGRFCAVATDQSVLCWGVNALSDTAGKGVTALVPTPAIGATQAFTQVAPGLVHTCALATDQNVWCWGDNSAGELGDRLFKSRQAPALVYGGFKFTGITSGNGHSCGLSVDGAVFCWGLNQNGQLGNGNTSANSSPVAVSGAFSFKQISAGQSFTCGLTTLGRTYCWGNLGTGSTVVLSPRTYTTAPDFTQIAAGAFHTCGLTADGSAFCWGDNSVGQLGDSTLVERANPTAVSTKIKFKSISAGVGHTCGNAIDGSVACWGLNKAGELGDSATTVTNRLTPRYIVLDVTP
jgi:alpha-tubulin suppressor-like RCC1 family protein